MRGEGRVRGAVRHSKIGFISEISFGNWSNGLSNPIYPPETSAVSTRTTPAPVSDRPYCPPRAPATLREINFSVIHPHSIKAAGIDTGGIQDRERAAVAVGGEQRRPERWQVRGGHDGVETVAD